MKLSDSSSVFRPCLFDVLLFPYKDQSSYLRGSGVRPRAHLHGAAQGQKGSFREAKGGDEDKHPQTGRFETYKGEGGLKQTSKGV